MTEIRNGVHAAELPSLTWRKSQHSGAVGNCVEVATLDGGDAGSLIAVRNSRYPEGPALIYTREEMAAFVTGAKHGEFDDLLA